MSRSMQHMKVMKQFGSDLESRPPKYTEAHLPKGVHTVVHHYHEGNDPNGIVRGKFKYVTQAVIRNSDNKKALCEGWSRCSKKDNPRRSVSRAIAIGRALKQYYNPTPF